MSVWQLPVSAKIGEKVYPLHADYRDVLEIFSYLEDPDLPEYLRWQIALGLLFEGEIPEEDQKEALEYLCFFLRGGGEEEKKSGPKLLDWQQDAPLIVADINKAAGQEIRALRFLHWWTFLSLFHSIGQGQLSAVVSIRDKLRRGKPLEGWEKEFYRENRHRVDLQKRYSKEELLQREKLNNLLGQ